MCERAKNSCTLNILLKLNLTTQTQISSYEKNSAEKSLVPWDPLGYLGSKSWNVFKTQWAWGLRVSVTPIPVLALAELWGRCALLPQCVALTIYPSEKGQYGKQKCIIFMVQSDLTLQCPSFGGKNVPRVHISCGLRHSPYNTAIEQLQN